MLGYTTQKNQLELRNHSIKRRPRLSAANGSRITNERKPSNNRRTQLELRVWCLFQDQ